MKLQDAFKYQIENWKPVTAEDLRDPLDNLPRIWQSMLIDIDSENKYSSGREICIGDRLLLAYVVCNTDRPAQLILEQSEIAEYEKKFKVIRVIGEMPILSYRDDSDDQYKNHDWQDNLT